MNEYEFIFKLEGVTFGVTFERDDDSGGAPWGREDGHGPVSDWRSKGSKRAGERVLAEHRGRARFYDVQAATQIARRDEWGLSDAERAKLAESLGHKPTNGEVTAAAVEADYRRMRAWCNDEWSYIGVIVHMLATSGEQIPDIGGSIWGVESDAPEYHKVVAEELASELLVEQGIAPDVKTWQKEYRIRE